MAKGPTKAEQYEAIFWAMEGDLKAKNLGAFPGRFYLAQVDTGTILVQANPDDPEIVWKVSESVVLRAIAIFVADIKNNLEGYNDWTPKHVRECFDAWRYRTPYLNEPKAFLWPTESGCAFQRLPWPKQVGPSPIWDAVVGRMTNGQAFRHFIGSLFVEDSDRQQYLVLYGEGQNGKGSINRILARIFGSAYHAGSPPMTGNVRFWAYYTVIGKRLLAFPDCDYAKFMQTEIFKQLTGDDPVACEEKGKAIFNYMPKAKLLIFSNVKPEISSAHSDMRRILYCEFDQSAGLVDSPDFEGALWREAGAFLTKCIHDYAAAHPKVGDRRPPIQIAEGAHDSLVAHVSSLEEDFEDAFESEFKFDPAFKSYVLPSRLQEILAIRFKDNRRRKIEFVAWMARKYGVKKRSLRDGDLASTPRLVYLGISIHRVQNRSGGGTLPSHLRPVD